MSDKLRYSISAIPDDFFRGGNAQRFEVHMGVAADDVKTFHGHVAGWLAAFRLFYEETAAAAGVKAATKNYKFRITDWNDGSRVVSEGDFPAYCNEEEMLYSLLYAKIFSECGVFLEEIHYNGCRYTEISDMRPLDNGYKCFSDGKPDPRMQSIPVQLQAVLNGSDKRTLYFFGPYIGKHGEDFIVCSYPLSNGIFIWDHNGPYRLCYAGMLPIFKHAEVIAEDGKTKKGIIPEMAHIFCIFSETEPVGVTFGVLLDGRLYPKINKNDKGLILLHTPFYQKLDGTLDPPNGFEHSKSPYDVIFEQVDRGKYLYIPKIESRFRDVVLTLTDEQEFCVESLGPNPTKEVMQKLLKDYVEAMYAAFCAAGEYHAETGHVFRHIPNTDDVFYVQTNGFELFLRPNASYYYYEMPESMMVFERWEFGTLFEIMGARFDVGDVKVVLSPKRNSELEIEVKEPGQDNKIVGEFSALEKTGFFAGAGLPQRIQFNISLAFFMQNLNLYEAIKKSIEADVHKFTRALLEIKRGISLKDMDDRLYEEDEIPDKDFITFAVELQSKFKRTRVIPNIALFGEAGTGKSTMAKRLAKVVFHKELQEATPSSLKARYLGWADVSVWDVISPASKNNAIVFIDEAYELMSDKFGREAVSILLPLMEGRRPPDKKIEDGKRLIEIKWSELEEIPPIWIAGYEDETRLMLNQNTGLYRRLESGILTPPTTGKLYSELLKLLEEAMEAIAKKEDSELFGFDAETSSEMEYKYKVLLKQFTDNEKLIKNYFQWGAQPQNSKYFAHHAGVRQFINKCLGRIDFNKGSAEITDQIEQVIRLRKREINHQVDTVRRDAEGGRNVLEKVEIITENKTRFKDLVGCDAQIAYMNSILDMIVDKRRYEQNNIIVPKGALLLGQPGVGKTFIARAMAGELQERFEGADEQVGFISLSASMLTTEKEIFIGSLFDKIEELFDACIIFIDEVDSIAKDRTVNKYASHLLELIKQMDGIEQRSKIFILAATNAGESLDPAFTRPGRIDKKMEFYLPDSNARCELVRRNIKKRSGLLANFEYEQNEEAVKELAGKVAARTPGYTPGGIEVIVNTAFMMYDQEKKAGKHTSEQEQKPLPFENAVSNEADAGKTEVSELEILLRHLYEAIEVSEAGELRSVKEDEAFSVEKNDESRSSTAIHEVGHALVSILLDIPFEKITSLPRGHALGYVSHDRERSMVTKEDFEKYIRIAMGGRAAEEIIYGKDRISAGASQDMRQATHFARLMAERWGFTEELGFMALMQDTARHLGQSAYTCSDAFREQSDKVVSDLLKKQYVKTMTMLEDKGELIKKLAEKVFHEKTMTGDEFKKFYENLNSNKEGQADSEGQKGNENPA